MQLIFDDHEFTPKQERELRRIVEAAERACARRDGLLVMVLTEQQWEEAMRRLLRGRRSRARYFLHLMIDPRDPRQLLVSPAALAGVGDRDPAIICEVLHTALLPSLQHLPPLLQRGARDLLAARIAKSLRLPRCPSLFPEERRVLQVMLNALREEHGYSEGEWLRQLIKRPERWLLALRKTPSFAQAVRVLCRDPQARAVFGGSRRRQLLLDHLTADAVRGDDPVVQMTRAELARHIREAQAVAVAAE